MITGSICRNTQSYADLAGGVDQSGHWRHLSDALQPASRTMLDHVLASWRIFRARLSGRMMPAGRKSLLLWYARSRLRDVQLHLHVDCQRVLNASSLPSEQNEWPASNSPAVKLGMHRDARLARLSARACLYMSLRLCDLLCSNLHSSARGAMRYPSQCSINLGSDVDLCGREAVWKWQARSFPSLSSFDDAMIGQRTSHHLLLERRADTTTTFSQTRT